jgi:adenylyltransferase/sulfurtransferase
VFVRQFPVRLTSANALELFGEFDLVVDGSDNFPTRYLANDAAALTHIPLVWGAVSQYGGQAGVSWHERGPSYRDLFPTPPPPGSVLSCEHGGVMPTAVAIVGGIMANEVIKIVTGLGAPLIGRVTTYDSLTGGFRELEYGRDPDAQAITGLIDYDLFCGMPSRSSTLGAVHLSAELQGEKPPRLIDVREQWEAAIASLPGALLIPLDTLDSVIGGLDPSEPVVVYCHHGIRSVTALETLRAHGFTAARHLEGGIDSWARTVDPDMARY